MREYRSVILLILIMTGVTLVVGGAAILILYETAMTQARERLTETARSHAILIDAIVGHELALGEPVEAAQRNAVIQIGLAYAAGGGASAVGDLNLARREGKEIVFLVRSDQPVGRPLHTAFDAPEVEPMRRALNGENGVFTSIAYLGRTVMAAYEPVPAGDLGVVSKIDLAELRAPFKRAGFAVLALALVMIGLGTTLFVQIGAPMIEHIRTSERRFRDLFESMSSGVAVFRAAGEGQDFLFTDLNPAGERIDQVSRSALLGRPLAEVLPGAEASGLLEVLRRVWLTGEAEHLPPRLYEDERIRGWRESIVYKLPGGEVVELFDDVTQRQATEEQLRHAQKMEVVGQLTGGVAHDFNNLLAIILGNLQLLRERLGNDPVARELVADALWSAERGAELTHRLLAFARRQPLNPAVTDVNVLIGGMIELVRRTVASSSPGNPAVAVEETLEQGLWPATIDRGQLESALMNLIVNARDAMPGGGTLTLSTANVVVEAPEVEAEANDTIAPGAYITVAVSDTGVGIPKDVIAHIFEPFFTTKRPGEGSGLGLSMVYGFAKQSGGHVEVESEPSRGTTVRLYLPRAQDPAGGKQGADAAALAAAG
ncbi:MAG: ATP-binding protein [Rhodospirillales bacterium]|nr:ATP-binding protein [Rhodospirillales bacterium]